MLGFALRCCAWTYCAVRAEAAVPALIEALKDESYDVLRNATLALEKIAAKGQYDAIVALGAVIRGGTPHFDYVAGECVKGMAQVTLKHGVPIAFGVLTVDTIEQAIERAGTKAGNKGGEAAASAIEMVNLLREL